MLFGYDRTKHSCALMESTLGAVECSVQSAAQIAAPVYQSYCQPSVDAVVNACSKGVENMKYVFDVSKSAAMLGVGAVVVATQLSLALGVAGANLLLDSLITSKRIAGNMLLSAKVCNSRINISHDILHSPKCGPTAHVALNILLDAERAMQQCVNGLIQQTQDLVQMLLSISTSGNLQVPVAKLSEQANILLDVMNAVVDRLFGLSSEADPAECTIGQRLGRLGRRVSGVLTSRAHDGVIDPLHNQLNTVMEQLAKSMILVDLIRKQQEWAVEKAGELHTSVLELKDRVEREAKQLKQKPEDILMRSLRHTSEQLINNLMSLKDKGKQVFSESTNAKLTTAVTYFGQFDESLANASDIYAVNEEVSTFCSR
ncbi:unnamed protein product [Anisakis simplex]|uniref:Perilipin n=1 Tax=Anisakis simplex TaxID=6269 RepID=A0A158PMU7_ANISI|nr:unnamed protein product [Anisakis simplex]